MQLSDAALAAIKTTLADPAKGWRMVTVNEAKSEHQVMTTGPTGLTVTTVIDRHVTLSIESGAGQILIFMLSGVDAAPATSASVIYSGSTFETTDAALIALLESKIPAVSDLLQATLIADLS